MAREVVGSEDRDGVRVLTLRNPPSNALTQRLRGALIHAVREVGANVRRIILCGAGPTFSSALALEEDVSHPTLAELCAAIEDCSVPVVAVLQGLVMGAGAELALAAARRVAAPDTRIALPDIALGLCPAGGTTRRLPTLIGAEAALNLLLSGRVVGAEEAARLGLVDRVQDDPFALALQMSEPHLETMPAGRSGAAFAAAVAAARRQYPQTLPAVGRIIACVEAAALLPREAHQAFEDVAREDLAASPEASALRAAAQAERRAAAVPQAMSRDPQDMTDRIALHGSGSGLTTVARLALRQGVAVDWWQADDAQRTATRAALQTGLSAKELSRLSDRIAQSLAAVHVLAGQGDPPPGARAVLVLGGADNHLGLGLAPAGRLCELAMPPGTPVEAVALTIAMLRRIGLSPLVVGHRPGLGAAVTAAGRAALARLARLGVAHRAIGTALSGFGAPPPGGLQVAEAEAWQMTETEILARWLGAMANEGFRLLDQGIARRPSDIDLALFQGCGFPRWRCGPMHLADRRGLLVLRHDLRRWANDDPIWAPDPMLDRLIGDGQRLSDLDQSDLV
ncbi:MAG: enoyl-CoA hydratase-related protein [Tabrizicola sp.]|jgi:3-hydroxyacyl-CoA dehydrogenase|nr:enoyl-CoA hydratase-related protein [Tabrizicola sp.]